MKALLVQTCAAIAILQLVFFGGAGCSPQAASPSSQQQAEKNKLNDEHSLEHMRSSLLDPRQLPHLMWRQKLTISTSEKKYHLEAIIQNDGAEFQVLALGPGGMKLFLVTQRSVRDEHSSVEISTQVFVDRKIDLSPEYLLFDIQRALFWTHTARCSSQINSWSFREFSVEDKCENGAVVKRRVSDGPVGSEQEKSHLDINYRPGFDFRSSPQELTLKHTDRDYQIDLVQLESHQLP